MSDRTPHQGALDDLARQVRQRHAEALEGIGPRPPGFPVCGAWRLREGEARGEDGHANTCPLAGLPAPRAEG
ncbi:MAG: hypothetical protein AB1578_18140 [Thermodesulfobacteriota bacterium]